MGLWCGRPPLDIVCAAGEKKGKKKTHMKRDILMNGMIFWMNSLIIILIFKSYGRQVNFIIKILLKILQLRKIMFAFSLLFQNCGRSDKVRL